MLQESIEQLEALPLLVGLREMVQLFPRSETTVYRWRTARRGRPPELPAPDLTIGQSPIWRADRILEFARARGIEADPEALAALRRAQGHH